MTKNFAVFLYTPDVPQGWAKKRVDLQSTSIMQAQIDVASTEDFKALFLKHGHVGVKAVPTHNESPSLNRTPEQEKAFREELKRRNDSTSNYRIGLQDYQLR